LKLNDSLITESKTAGPSHHVLKWSEDEVRGGPPIKRPAGNIKCSPPFKMGGTFFGELLKRLAEHIGVLEE
jgi:hypothetical protein